MKKLIFAFHAAMIAAIGLTPRNASADVFKSDDYTRRMPITFSGYDGSAPLSDFPALVRLDSSVTSEMLENGADLRFADSLGQALPHEIDSWDTNGISFVWVKTPTLDADTVITAYFGNPAADSRDALPPSSVWSEYTGVWHFNEESGDLLDSTANQIHAERNGNLTETNGVSTRSQFFDGDNASFARVSHNAVLDFDGRFTISAWYRWPDDGVSKTYSRLFSKRNGNSGWEVEIANPYTFSVWGAGGNAGGVSMPDGCSFNNTPREWYHLSYQYRAHSSGAFYVNGVLAREHNLGGTKGGDNTASLRLGGDAAGFNWRGFVDEVRIEKNIRSADWIKACCDTMTNSFFAVCGPAENNAAELYFHAANVKWDTADIILAANMMTPIDALLYWGGADGGDGPWEFGPITMRSQTPTNSITENLTGLIPDKQYWARYAITNEFGVPVFQTPPITFTTVIEPIAVIGDVSFFCTPQSSVITVNLISTGYTPMLVFTWDVNGSGGGALTNYPSGAGGSVFTLPPMPPNSVCAWRADLFSDYDDDVKSGAYEVVYNYTWKNAASGLWMNGNNWDVGEAPNHRGAVVTVPGNNTVYSIDIAGMGSVTVGKISNNGTGRPPNIIAGDGTTPFVLDNIGGEPAEFSSDTNGDMATIRAPVILNSGFLISCGEIGSYVQPLIIDGTITGANADITIAKGHFRWIVAQDTVFTNNIRGRIFSKAGAGKLTLKGDTVYRTRDSGWEHVDGGVYEGTLVFDGGTTTNSSSPRSYLFGGYYGGVYYGKFAALEFKGGNKHTTVDEVKLGHTYSVAFAGYTNNIVTLTDAGTEWDASAKPVKIISHNNLMRVRDGAVIRNVSEFRIGENSLSQNRNNMLDIGGGGTVFADTVSIMGTNNALRTSGGEIICDSLTINSGNYLAPLVSAANGTGVITVNGTVTFADGARIRPEIEQNAPCGEYTIMTFETLAGDGLDNEGIPRFVPETLDGVWRLRLKDNALILRYSQFATFIIVK